MKIFRSYTLTWYDMGILKWTILIIGIYVGSKWPETFASLDTLLLILGVAGTFYLVGKYWKKIF